jgi:hypothetical protein
MAKKVANALKAAHLKQKEHLRSAISQQEANGACVPSILRVPQLSELTIQVCAVILS